MVSTSSISSLGSLRPFIERAFHRSANLKNTAADIESGRFSALPATVPPVRKAAGPTGV